MKGISAVHETEEERGFLVFRGLALAITLGAIVVVGLTMVGLGLLPSILETVGLADGSADVLHWVRWPLLILIVVVAITLLYQIGPDVPTTHWRFMVPGAVFATAMWLGLSAILSRFGSRIFASHGETYGTLAGLIILLIWLMLSVLSVLVGAEIEAHRRLGELRATPGEPEPDPA
jgi:membrane protein